MLPWNLLEESGRGAIYLAVRRGSGPPVLSITGVTPGPGAATGWNITSAATYDQSGSLLANVTLYFTIFSEMVRCYLRRVLRYRDVLFVPD